ncbi:hypothetical protein DPMN_057756 [Dreissena polymorpha]|uniref:Uncharacterized protein n=1 Tax=Dreissena polymorpha TaxID=45954 RepID=A0A9D4HCK1_DREPO|nr:hypothetical protein DPMN_057756 [Dreissena polymorpha]
MFKEDERKRKHRGKYFITVDPVDDIINRTSDTSNDQCNESGNIKKFCHYNEIDIDYDPMRVGNCQVWAISHTIESMG